MPKRSRTPSDSNLLARQIVREATGESTTKEKEPVDKGKNPAAVALGKLGGKKGGPARAAKLSATQRKEIAVRAARARWSKE